MSDVIDLSKPTGHFEVTVTHHDSGVYEVVVDRGFGGCGEYETDNRDKAVAVAEYCESMGRYSRTGTNVGEPFTGSIFHWNCDCSRETVMDREKNATRETR